MPGHRFKIESLLSGAPSARRCDVPLLRIDLALIVVARFLNDDRAASALFARNFDSVLRAGAIKRRSACSISTACYLDPALRARCHAYLLDRLDCGAREAAAKAPATMRAAELDLER
jgi:hypothetical protein